VIPLALCSVSLECPVSSHFFPAVFIHPLMLKQQFIYWYVYIILSVLCINIVHICINIHSASIVIWIYVQLVHNR
jgi:hypothetical protein